MSQRIIVIDDDKTTRNLFKFVLTDAGWDVSTFDYAQIDLKVVQQRKPDLILLDINLVQAGIGWSFLQLLKMEPQTAEIPLVICTTASNLSLEIEGYLAARHISIVRKPFRVDAFIQTIRKNLVPNHVPPILVVEDNLELADSISTILRLWGYLVESASNGRLALDAVTQAQYCLILLDNSIPARASFDFLAAYAQLPEPHSPVIIFNDDTYSVSERLQAFVMAVFPKPFEFDDLITLVSSYAQPISGEIGFQ